MQPTELRRQTNDRLLGLGAELRESDVGADRETARRARSSSSRPLRSVAAALATTALVAKVGADQRAKQAQANYDAATPDGSATPATFG
jgi:hypothetical protein